MASTELEKNSSSTELAPLYAPMDMTDIQLPSVKIVYALSEQAKAGIAKEGDVILTFGNEDQDPTFLIGGGTGETEFTAYVIGSDKTAVTTKDGGMDWQAERDYNDPYSQDVWFFQLAIPSVEALIPVRLMLWKASGSPAARQINTMLTRDALLGNHEPLCIRLSTTIGKSKTGSHTYHKWVAGRGTADPDDMVVAKELQAKLHTISRNRKTENDLIEDQPSF